jgi:hypothetical protein
MTEQVETEEFSTLVYKGFGPHSRAGGTYDFSAAKSQEEFDAKLADGWHATLPEAIDAHEGKVSEAAPTRAELEAKAKELGISVGKKTTDAALAAAIEEQLKKAD